jgi:hypothetical protein
MQDKTAPAANMLVVDDPMEQVMLNQTRRGWAGLALAALALLAACGQAGGSTAQQQRAIAMWQERCKRSGEFIHKTVEGVEGIYLINIRLRFNHGEQPEDQFALTDPYGHDSTKDEYVLNFLQGFYHQLPRHSPPISGVPQRTGYLYVEAVDYMDSKLTRYTGRVEEPWQQNKSYLKGYTRFVLDRAPIEKRTARYGVKFEDISTREEREHWIAGSSLKVIDLTTQEVLGERVGYMVDWAQGSRAGGRSPWLFAADNACPSFFKVNPKLPVRHASTAQEGQTLDFVEKILKPISREQ